MRGSQQRRLGDGRPLRVHVEGARGVRHGVGVRRGDGGQAADAVLGWGGEAEAPQGERGRGGGGSVFPRERGCPDVWGQDAGGGGSKKAPQNCKKG